MDELDDITLARARRGEPDAQARLVRAYQHPVYALLSRMRPGPPDRVDDLAQDTFVKVLRSLATFSPNGPARLSTWILTIATRTAIDAHRRSAKQVVALPDDLPEPAADEGPEGWTEAKWLKARVERAMAALDEEQRAVLILRAYHDLDYPEIAEALSLEVGTVKSRLSRARAALRAAMKGASS